MFSRQATRLILVLSLLSGLWACSSANQPAPTPVVLPSPASTYTPLPVPTQPTATPTPLTCLSQPGQLQTGSIPTDGAPTTYIIYLPPCYDYFTDQRYPVLYLLNGLPMDANPDSTGTQWVRIGAPEAADKLIHSGQAEPFIMVFPEDRYWNVPQGSLFGQFMIDNIIPYIDQHYRTIADRPHRAIGGLSRGGGWAFQLGMTHPELFGSVGLHSPAIFPEDRANIEYWFRTRDPNSWPRFYIDSGDNDMERGMNVAVETLFSTYEIPHEWHLNTGEHNETYWHAHVMEYLVWYAQGFAQAGPPLPTFTPTAAAPVPSATTASPLSSATVTP